MKGFDLVARCYDLLSLIVFQDNIFSANRRLVDWVKPYSKVLILGGGTGELIKYFYDSISIDYVELSKEMIAKAKARSTKSKMFFYHADFLEYDINKKYDYILCPFFLDLFQPNDLSRVVEKIKLQLKSEGHLLVADFSPDGTTFFNRILLQLMILFFRFFSGIKIKEYNRLFDVLTQSGFVVTDQSSLRNKFILMKKFQLFDKHKS